MNIKTHSNSITLLNLFWLYCDGLCELRFRNGFYFVCLGIFLDFFDGFFALIESFRPLGLELDSLADMVTSGVVPDM
jgi:CDP-diacylglycerol--serine O-phosphatidyltransferase